MEYRFDNEQRQYTTSCVDRSGLFSELPTDPVSVLKEGFLSCVKSRRSSHATIPADLPLVVMTEVAWFVQLTRTDHAYETNGSVNKQGISLSETLYRDHSWYELADWYDLLTQIQVRYELNEDKFCQLRVIACHMFTRRRLGEPFKVFLCSSTENRGIYVDVTFQSKVTTNPCPFVPKKIEALKVGEKTCLLCHKVCKTTCKGCKSSVLRQRMPKGRLQKTQTAVPKLLAVVPLKECLSKHQTRIFKIPDLRYLASGQ